jgi:hypothetical protein
VPSAPGCLGAIAGGLAGVVRPIGGSGCCAGAAVERAVAAARAAAAKIVLDIVLTAGNRKSRFVLRKPVNCKLTR